MCTSFYKLTQVIENVKQTLVTSLFQTFQVAAYDAGVRHDVDMISMKSADVVPEKIIAIFGLQKFRPSAGSSRYREKCKNLSSFLP